MVKQYQVTLFNPTGEYKPVSCIVNRQQETDEDMSTNSAIRKEIQREGVIKICQKRYWTLHDLTKYKFTKYKIRPYVKEESSK